MSANIYSKPLVRVAGDQGIIMEFGDGISPSIHERVRAMAYALEQRQIDGIVETVQTYRAVVVYYDQMVTSFARLEDVLLDLCRDSKTEEAIPTKTIELPVCYGREFGPDLELIATSKGLSEDEVIRLHSNPEYLVYMVGFTPGFPFLGGLPEILHTPRLNTPRKKVPAGSVGIANSQTGVYPIESPGGWQLIGQTPVAIFEPEAKEPFKLNAGDTLKFRPIGKSEYYSILDKV